MNALGGEAELLPFALTRFEKLVQKRSPVAFGIPESRNESADRALVLNRDLNEFAVFQKRIHPGIVVRGCGGVLRTALRGREQHSRNQETAHRTQRNGKSHGQET